MGSALKPNPKTSPKLCKVPAATQTFSGPQCSDPSHTGWQRAADVPGQEFPGILGGSRPTGLGFRVVEFRFQSLGCLNFSSRLSKATWRVTET